MASDRHVLVKGGVFLYHLKAPFSASGESIDGALEYDKKSDKVKCHECGEWFSGLGPHVRMAHRPMTARAYKAKHGLRQSTALLAEGVRTRASSRMVSSMGIRFLMRPEVMAKARMHAPSLKGHKYNNKVESLNSRQMCPAQIIEKISRLRDLLGHTPSINELKEHRISVRTMRYIFGSVGSAMRVCGLEPNQTGKGGMRRSFTDEQLMEFLRSFFRAHSRAPRTSDFKREFLPTRETYVRRYGSLRNAWKKSGLPLDALLVPVASSGHRYVYFHHGKWEAIVKHGAKKHFLGTFADPRTASERVQRFMRAKRKRRKKSPCS